MRSGVDQNFFSRWSRTVSLDATAHGLPGTRARGIDVAQSELVVAFFPHTYVYAYTPKRSFGIFHFEVTVFILQLQLNVYVNL